MLDWLLLIFFYSVRFLYCSFSVSLYMLERLSGERDGGIKEEGGEKKKKARRRRKREEEQGQEKESYRKKT